MNQIDLQAPTLAGPPQTNLGAGTPSCTSPPQLTTPKYIFILWFKKSKTLTF